MTISKLSSSASLKQVMDKFEEISLTDFFNIDVIIRSELPQQVKEGQVVVISNTNGKIYMCKEKPNNMSNGDVFIEVNTIDSFVNMPMSSDSVVIGIPLYKTIQLLDGVDVKTECYVGINGVWTLTTPAEFYIFKEGVGIYEPLRSFTGTGCSVSASTQAITFTAEGGNGIYSRTATSVNKIDLTDYSTAEIDAVGAYSHSITITLGGKSVLFNNTRSVKTIDLSSVTGSYNLVLKLNTPVSGAVSAYIYNIKLIPKNF